MITPELLRRIMPTAGEKATLFAEHLERARVAWVGDDPDHVAHWLAQVGHESGDLRYTQEVWGPTPAQSRYEGRKDLGNTEPGDGYRFRGRGLIQLTGRSNVARYSSAAGRDFVSNPDELSNERWAADSAGWFWKTNNIGSLVSAPDPVLAITRRINGGTNGLADRRARYQRAREVLLGAPQATPHATPHVTPQEPPKADRPKEMKLIPAIIAALIPGLISALPELGRILKVEDKSDRNIAIATKALEVIAPAVSAANAQDAVEKINSDPVARDAAREAVAPMLEVIEVGGGIKAAREFNVQMMTTGSSFVRAGWGALIGLLAIAIVIGGGWIMREVLLSADFDPQTKGSIIGYLQNVGLIVAGFAFGSSVGSRRKDER